MRRHPRLPAYWKLTPNIISLRHCTLQVCGFRFVVTSCNCVGVPGVVCTTRQAPVVERLRTIQETSTLSRTMLPDCITGTRCAIHRSFTICLIKPLWLEDLSLTDRPSIRLESLVTTTSHSSDPSPHVMLCIQGKAIRRYNTIAARALGFIKCHIRST